MDESTLKTIVEATLARLNSNGRNIATLFDAYFALQKKEQALVEQAFASIFANYSLSEVAAALNMLTPMCQALQDEEHAKQMAARDAQAQSMTPPPEPAAPDPLAEELAKPRKKRSTKRN